MGKSTINDVPIINYKWLYQNIGYILGIYWIPMFEDYPLVNIEKTVERSTILQLGKSTINGHVQ